MLSQVKHPNINVGNLDQDLENLTTTTTVSPIQLNKNLEPAFLDRFILALKDSEEPLPRNLVNPILKDTVTIPSGGYSIIRVETNNPGKKYSFEEKYRNIYLKIGIYINIFSPKIFLTF